MTNTEMINICKEYPDGTEMDIRVARFKHGNLYNGIIDHIEGYDFEDINNVEFKDGTLHIGCTVTVY